MLQVTGLSPRNGIRFSGKKNGFKRLWVSKREDVQHEKVSVPSVGVSFDGLRQFRCRASRGFCLKFVRQNSAEGFARAGGSHSLRDNGRGTRFECSSPAHLGNNCTR